MPPILTSCITLTPTSDPAGTDSNTGPEQASGWSRYWNVSKSIAKSIHPGFDPHQGPDQPDTPWIQLNIQPRELALRLVQKTIPANSYLNTINQLVMACMALASLHGCGGASPEGSNPASTHGSATVNATGSNKPTTRASSPDTSSAPTMAASTVPPGSRGKPIPVDGAAVLAKVGKDPCYPANGTYAQTTDIDAGNHSPIPHFTGEYNGNGNTISNLKGCLFNSLEGNGTVRNLTISNGHIDRAGLPGTNDTGSAALVACTMSGGSRQENIVVENSKIRVTAVKPWVQQHRQLGMLAGKMNDSTVLRDNQINNVNIAIQGSGIDVGMLAGQALDRATIDSNQVENCKVFLSGIGSGKRTLNSSRAETNINIGLIAGKMVGNEHNNVVVKNSTLIHNRIESSPGIFAANIGGVAGRADFARIEDTQAHNQNKIDYHSLIIDGRIAMVVADARHCTILDTSSRDNHLLATANSFLPAHVGIVTANCHNSTIKHTLDIDSDLELSHSSFREDSAGGHAAVAAAVAEGCSIHNTTARETIIDAETDKSSVAIAVAFNDANTTVHRTTAVDCRLFAWEKNTNSYTGSAAVGVAAGRQDNFGRISDTRACGSVIKGYRAGIAAGDPDRNFSGTFACNTELTSFADGISTTVNLACDNASCPATDRADIATVAAGNGTVNSTASALHNNSEEVDVEFPTALTGGIVAGGMIAGGVTLYALYQWYQGYWQGLKGKALAIYPLTRIKETISQRFSTANPDMELSELVGAGDTSLSS